MGVNGNLKVTPFGHVILPPFQLKLGVQIMDNDKEAILPVLPTEFFDTSIAFA